MGDANHKGNCVFNKRPALKYSLSDSKENRANTEKLVILMNVISYYFSKIPKIGIEHLTLSSLSWTLNP